MAQLATDPAAIRALQTYKGWLFVACTAALLYVSLRAELGRFAAESAARQSAEDEQRAAEERLRQVVESIREVFWLRDARDGRVRYVSPAYESVWGRPVASLLADPAEWLAAAHPEDADGVAAAVARAAAGESYDLEYRILRPDGAIRWVRELAFPIRDASGEVVRVSGVAEDVTERRALVDQLQQTQRLESIGLLAGGVAHDFNNLLTVISGNVELLLLELADQPELAVLATDIQRAGERAGSLTRQLLAFSRREVLEPRALDLDAVVLDTEKMLRRLLGEDVVLETGLAAGGNRLRADPGHLVQVLMNLAVNARDAMPRGGRLRISTAVVGRRDPGVSLPAKLEADRYIELVVADSGCGMSDEVRARAFEPFFTTKGVGRGTGLGLAVVHGIVRQSGGDVEVESAPGAGDALPVVVSGLQRLPERRCRTFGRAARPRAGAAGRGRRERAAVRVSRSRELGLRRDHGRRIRRRARRARQRAESLRYPGDGRRHARPRWPRTRGRGAGALAMGPGSLHQRLYRRRDRAPRRAASRGAIPPEALHGGRAGA